MPDCECNQLCSIPLIQDLKALKKVELNEKLQKAKENVEWFQKMCNRYKDDEAMTNRLNEHITEYEKIQKEIDNL